MKKITTQNKLQEVVREREGLGVSPLHKLAPKDKTGETKRMNSSH